MLRSAFLAPYLRKWQKVQGGTLGGKCDCSSLFLGMMVTDNYENDVCMWQPWAMPIRFCCLNWSIWTIAICLKVTKPSMFYLPLEERAFFSFRFWIMKMTDVDHRWYMCLKALDQAFEIVLADLENVEKCVFGTLFTKMAKSARGYGTLGEKCGCSFLFLGMMVTDNYENDVCVCQPWAMPIRFCCLNWSIWTIAICVQVAKPAGRPPWRKGLFFHLIFGVLRWPMLIIDDTCVWKPWTKPLRSCWQIWKMLRSAFLAPYLRKWQKVQGGTDPWRKMRLFISLFRHDGDW